MTREPLNCPGCGKPEPASWCWDGRDLDCPLRYPPRWAEESTASRMLWGIARDLHEKVQALQPDERCAACHGRGTWDTECCNGASGCGCRGQLVQMGSCHACGGTGHVRPGEQNPLANANWIMNNNVSYPGGGPTDGWLR